MFLLGFGAMTPAAEILHVSPGLRPYSSGLLSP